MSPDNGQSELPVVLAVALVVTVAAAGIALGGAAWSSSGETVASSAQDQEGEGGPALVRFAHVSPDTLNVNVTVGDQQLATNVSMGTVSDYFRVAPGTHDVTVTRATTQEQVLFEDTITVEAGSSHTVAVAGESSVGEEAAFGPTVLADDANETGENESAIRLAHFVPDAPAVDVAVQGTDRVLFEDVSYRNASEYATVPAGNHTLEVRRATENGSGEVIATVNVSLNGSTAYTAFAVGYLQPEQAIVDTPLDVVVAAPTVSEPSPGTMITPTPEGSPAATESPTETETETETPTPTEEGDDTEE